MAFALRERAFDLRVRAALLPCLILSIVFALPAPVAGQHPHHPEGWVGGPGSANYELAARFAPYKAEELVYSTEVDPNWIEHGDRFWYEWKTSEGTFYYIVDPARGTKRQIFDNDRIAAELTRITKDPWDGKHLPIRNIRFVDPNTLQFEVETSQDAEKDQGQMEEEQQQEQQQQRDRDQRRSRRAEKEVMYFEYDVTTRTLRRLEDYEAPDRHPRWASVSPDGEWVVFSREFNLWMMPYSEYEKILDARRGKSGDEADEAEEKVEVQEIQLTTDGEEYYSYGFAGRGEIDEETEKEHHKRQPAGISWSRDSRWFALTRNDDRKVGMLWVVHAVGYDRPKLESYKYDMAGEENVTQQELLVFDMESREMKKIDDDPWKDERMGVFDDPVESTRTGFRFFRRGDGGGDAEEPPRQVWLSTSSDELYFWRRSRDQHRVDVMVANPATGEVHPVIEERLNTYVEHQDPWRLPNGDLIWWSERDGWAHLYRIAPDGTVRTRLTQGPWHVSGIEGVDQERGFVYFTANDREEGEDPYYNHLYRVGLDGSGLRLLDPGDFDHQVEVAESNRYFVDNYSRVNTVPKAALRNAAGETVMELEEADFSRLMEAGYQFPEPFTVKAADGVTDLYGVMYKPYDFDPEKIYPIVEYVYPGPQTEAVSKSFDLRANEQGLAQFGFIVVTVGNRGGHPDRSKWYHNYGYGNLRDYGLADKKATAEQLAERYPWVDLDRVGIYGHSGGGFMTAAAMLVYPDFFKVGVSESGNHNNDVYNTNWSEKHHGIKEVVDDSGHVSFEYSIPKNSDLAANLKGHLLLSTGDVDNNVHHAGTFRLADALIKANKRFDFFILPGQRHSYRPVNDYWFWVRSEYFVKHLLGDERWNADLIQLQVEHQKTGSWGRRNGGRP